LNQPDEDELLVRRVGRGDKSAFHVLVMRHLPFCLRVAERMLANRSDAEDVVQDVCVKIWNEAAQWKPQAKFTTWLYRVVFNACIDYRRKIVRLQPDDEIERVDERENPEQTLAGKEKAMKVLAALQKLPERQRAAVVLSYYEDLRNQEAAEAMGMEIGAFQQLLFRARQGLKARFVG
jgi:RNA polymerase sigma-70 factor (ECF subfamily)